MAYPPAPWTLRGHSLQTLNLVDVAKARPFVPPELDIVSVLPGKTLGSVYVAAYETGSSLEYNELIVVPALVRYGNQIGSWISHIYVDNPDSVAGGREIWGLPKELADFSWQMAKPGQVTVQQGSRSLCTLTYDWQFNLWRQYLPVPGLSMLQENYLLFKGEAEANLALVGAKLVIPTESPFAGLDLGQPWLTIQSKALKLVAGAPSIVGHRNSAQATVST
jgi:hypothetical protein